MDFDQFADRYDEMLVGQHSFFARERGFFHASKISHASVWRRTESGQKY
jgi:hypothetical protein